MTDQLRVLLEIGPNGKRIVAAAMDWPGLERWGRIEHDAVDRLRAYVLRHEIPGPLDLPRDERDVDWRASAPTRDFQDGGEPDPHPYRSKEPANEGEPPGGR